MRTEKTFRTPFHRVLMAFLLTLFSITCVSAQQADKQTDDRGLKIQALQSVDKWPASTKRWALVVGVDQYDDKRVAQLNGAANDARALSKVLEKNAGFPSKQIVLLTSDQTGDRQPTRANILRELSDLSSVVPKDGLLFVAFSGHGLERSQQVFLLPSDAQVKNLKLIEQTSIPATLISDWFRMKVQQVLVVIDSCRSYPSAAIGAVIGGIIGGRSGAAIGAVPYPTFAGLKHLAESLKKKPNIDERNEGVVAFAILYATESGHTAYEDSKRRQGYLTSAVVRALEGEAANTYGDVTLAGLLKYVQDRVPKSTMNQIGNEQRPFYSIEGYKAEELVIAVIKR